MKVTVLQPFQVTHDGQNHRPGDTADVPDPVGELWLRSGWVEPVDSGAKKSQAALDAEESARVDRLVKPKDATKLADEHGIIQSGQ